MSNTVPPSIGEIRAKAWETRREKYGPRGHAGSYQRPCSRCEPMIALLIDLHHSGVLSEGQIAEATGLNRIEIRKRCDALDGAA